MQDLFLILICVSVFSGYRKISNGSFFHSTMGLYIVSVSSMTQPVHGVNCIFTGSVFRGGKSVSPHTIDFCTTESYNKSTAAKDTVRGSRKSIQRDGQE